MQDDIVTRLALWEDETPDFKEAKNTIIALRAELAHANTCNRGLVRLNQETQARAEAAEAERDRLREALAEKVRVKPLAWGPDEAPDDHCHYDHCTSSGGAWSYRIERLRQIRRDRWKGWKRYDSFVIYRDEEYLEAETTLIAAKAAAQADYEARIIAALTTKGDVDERA